VAKALRVTLGKMTVSKFADNEVGCQILENVRGCDCFLIQPTSPPVNDNMMELCLIVDTLKRASAKRITVVMTYFAYGRQDRKTKSRVPISASLMARLIQESGVDHVLSVELHSGQIQGFFSIPVDDISVRSVLLKPLERITFKNPVTVVAPDAAGSSRAEEFKNYFSEQMNIDTSFAVMNKWKLNDESLGMELVGKVQGYDCIIVDDMIDTGKTLLAAVKELKRCGAQKIYACITHALFNDIETLKELINSPDLEKLIVTNTLHHQNPDVVTLLQHSNGKIVVESVGNILAETIRRIHFEESLVTIH